jgi:hypothetical protein
MNPQAPEQCPYCGSRAVIPIVYGLPSPKLEKAAARGEVAFGGRLVPQPQRWECRDCGMRWPLPEDVLRSDLIREALDFMYRAHRDQLRKGDDLPYVDHPIEVAELVQRAGLDETVVAAALLHDVVEDTDVTIDEIRDRFGAEVARLVAALTDDRTIENYLERKVEHRNRVAGAGAAAAAIYAADKLANLRSLRAAYAVQGEAVEKRFNAPLDVMVARLMGDLSMLGRFHGASPYLVELASELADLRIDRARARSRGGRSAPLD